MEAIRLTMAQAVVNWLIAQKTVIQGETVPLSRHQITSLVDFFGSVNQLTAAYRCAEEADRRGVGPS